MGEVAYSEGEDAAELGGDLGMEPIEWQSLVLSDWCACDAEGRPAYVTCGLDVPRQNGKNAVIEIYEVFRLAVCGWHILHTAHRVKTAKKAFNRLVRYFTDKEPPRALVPRREDPPHERRGGHLPHQRRLHRVLGAHQRKRARLR